MKVEIQDIWASTNGGLDIIESYYPQVIECVGTNKAFKIRDERTASAHIKKYNDIWYVTDFGNDGKGKNGIEVCMEEENISFCEAIQLLSERFNIQTSDSPNIHKPIIESRVAHSDEKEGDFSYESKGSFTEREMKIWGRNVNQTHLDALSWQSLQAYKITKMDENKRQLMTTIIKSTENAPIFLRKVGTACKIYQPLASDKKWRFFYMGEKPKDFVNGLEELNKAYTDFNEKERSIFESDPANEGKTYKEKKLEDAVLCSGEKDACNCLSMGHHPIWLNSETADFTSAQYQEVMKYVKTLYNIPDIDSTGIKRGREVARKFIDIRTVKLPKELGYHPDHRGNPMKDLADYLKLHPRKSDFENLLKNAMPLRFWESTTDEKRNTRISINTLFYLNFLTTVGFSKLKDPITDEEMLVQVKENIIKTVNANEIRRFTLDWLAERHVDNDVQNAMLNSNRTKESTINDLPLLDISLSDSDNETQFFPFKNCCVKVSKSGVETKRLVDCGRYFKEDVICDKPFKRTESAFHCQQKDDDSWTININHHRSKFFEFLINTSRTQWREELEIRKDDEEEKNISYAESHKFDIFGDRLSDNEKAEQEQNLISKLFYIGYLLHSYKDATRPHALWLLEDTISSDGVSSGGSGKSFLMRHLDKTLCSIAFIGGKNKRLMDNQFLFEGVTGNTKVILIDDALPDMDFTYFYDMITGSMTINKKHKASKTIDFSHSPKIVITSNFVPTTLGHGSTDRRVKFGVFSDYYHQKTIHNDYLENRRIMDDFDMEIGGPKYTDEMWNDDYNFLMDCVHFYLSNKDTVSEIDPPMNKILKRFANQTIGDTFREWAEIYFKEDGEHVNRAMNKIEVFTDFIGATNVKGWQMHRFTKSLKTFADQCEWIEALNPEPYGRKDGRYIVSENGKTVEKLYLQTVDRKIK